MEREQEEMQFLGLIDIYIEAYKIIYKWRKIFSQITLALILPLSFILLAHMEVSHLLYTRIWHTNFQLHHTQTGTTRYNKLSDLMSSERAALWLFRVVYFTFFLVFSLLSTAAVVYTIASIYTGREVTFKKVMSVVPKVWKRLMVTFLCMFVAFFAYFCAAIGVIVLWYVNLADTAVHKPSLILIFILFVVGVVYMTIIWLLASVVTVLEDSCGVEAMMKSKKLIKGKFWITVIIFFTLILSKVAVNYLFQNAVVHQHRWSLGTLRRIGIGVLCFLLLFTLILFKLVIETIIYFVCKSYHHENIDKSILSDHLEVYLGEYEPLKAKDVQLEQYQV